MSKVKKVIESLSNENSINDKELISFEDYLEIVLNEPWVTRNTNQLLRDMLLSSGVEYTLSSGKTMKQKYNFFEDKKHVDDYVVFGQQKAKENLVEKLNNAARGLESSKRLWILLGPPGSAKSRTMEALKNALNKYSSSEKGKTYTVLLPTVDKRLEDKALIKEDGISYIQSPIYERPLQIIPKHNRKEIIESLNSNVNQDSLSEFYEENSHYDNNFKIGIDGDISPYSDKIIKDFMETKGITDFKDLIPFLKVRRMVYDSKSKNGIGSYTPRDEKSQEAGSLVGNIDYSLLPKFGSESHPLVHDYKGELCVGANGFVEIHEILKLSDKFLYELLFATQDRFFKPEGQSPIPFNGVIIGHTNFHEYNMFMENEAFEALRSRTTFIEMPLSVDFREEEKIYKLTYSNDTRNWDKDKKHVAHTAPHSLELLSLVSCMSRLLESKKHKDVSLLQKALIYSGRTDSGVDNNMSQSILKEFEFSKTTEGTFGLDPRFIQNVFEKTEHFKINEYIANIKKFSEEDDTMLNSLALNNPCVSPLDLYVKLDYHIKDIFSKTNKTILDSYIKKVLPKAKEWIFNQIAGDVYSAILRDDSVVENTWKKYTDHVKAFAHNTTVKHEVSHDEVKPDEEFMKDIEKYIGIPDKETFRKELSDAISSVNYKVLLKDEPSYENAIKKYVFENEFKSQENIKLLGWIKSGSSSANVNSKEKEQLNDTINYLMKEKGYCGHCAYQALSICANMSSIN
jgi:serine protein kinase